MKQFTYSDSVSTGLAIFSMLFGAGNLMYPIHVGMNGGQYGLWGIAGFIITAVCLPVLGLMGMVLFDGDYNAFFNRIGYGSGQVALAICFLVLGPLIALPRIITLSHTMVGPYVPGGYIDGVSSWSAFLFSLIFIGITYFAAYQESKIVNLLGNIISPLLLISLGIIIVRGVSMGTACTYTENSFWFVFKDSLIEGYETLDLLGTLFFSSIVIGMIKRSVGKGIASKKQLIMASLLAGSIGISLLALVYIGMAFLGMYHGHGLSAVHPDLLFRVIAYSVMGSSGALIIGTAVLMACFSTAIALATIVAEYTQDTLFRGSISYHGALALVLVSSVPLSVGGLAAVRQITGGPLLYIGYPVLITITIGNILYKCCNVTAIKVPVLVVALTSFFLYFW